MCSLYHGVGLFSLFFLKCKGATTVSDVLEKRESIVSVTLSFSALLDMLRNQSGRLLTKQSFVVEVMVI